MTNDELLQMIKDPPEGPISMSITNDGAVLKIGEIVHSITDHQAEILYDHGGLMLMQRIRLGRQKNKS